jgi:hypothetical protein
VPSLAALFESARSGRINPFTYQTDGIVMARERVALHRNVVLLLLVVTKRTAQVLNVPDVTLPYTKMSAWH